MALTVSSPLGDADYPCKSGGMSLDTVTTPGAVDALIACNLGTAAVDGGGQEGAYLRVRDYHGSDTYVFQCDGAYAGASCSADGRVGASFPLGDDELFAWPASPAFPAAACTVTIDGPPRPTAADQVSGDFSCDPIQAYFTDPPAGSSSAGVATSIVGHFDYTRD